ncbi:MAG: glycine cleavage system aminomethyltransferase GcvT [Candidatus Nanopelagicales bacterium]
MPSDSELRTTPMHAWHVASGAKMGDFAGWSMPLEYPSGTVTEHRAVRSGCGIFDVSHMGNLSINGEAAAEAANTVLTNDLARLQDGDVQYTLLCDESGGVIDDMLITRESVDRSLVVPNAANTAAVLQVLRGALGDSVADHSESTAIVAVQGPRSAAVLTSLGLPTDLEYMTARAGEHEGHPVLVSRTGYTGELGFEVILASEGAPSLWEHLAEVPEVTPCGLGARDTLRTEMGYALHGHEISADISPVAAMLGWAVGWDKPEFPGREALVAERADPGGRRLRGLLMTGRGVPRPGMTVMDDAGTIGVTTSGTFSPSLGQGIALALLDREVQPGDEVSVDIRGRAVGATVVKPPFVQSSPK